MTKVSELVGSELDYWVALAEGIPAEQLTIRRVPRTDDFIVVRDHLNTYPSGFQAREQRVMSYSTDWSQGGPLIDRHVHMLHHFELEQSGWLASAGMPKVGKAQGDTALIAICRAVVRSVFGDEVVE